MVLYDAFLDSTLSAFKLEGAHDGAPRHLRRTGNPAEYILAHRPRSYMSEAFLHAADQRTEHAKLHSWRHRYSKADPDARALVRLMQSPEPKLVGAHGLVVAAASECAALPQAGIDDRWRDGGHEPYRLRVRVCVDGAMDTVTVPSGAVAPAAWTAGVSAQAVAAQKAGGHLLAKLLYDMCMAERPVDRVVLSNRSACLAQLGRHDEALGDAELIRAIAPSWPKGHLRKAQALAGSAKSVAEPFAAAQARARQMEALSEGQNLCTTAAESKPFDEMLAALAGPQSHVHGAAPAVKRSVVDID